MIRKASNLRAGDIVIDRDTNTGVIIDRYVVDRRWVSPALDRVVVLPIGDRYTVMFAPDDVVEVER